MKLIKKLTAALTVIPMLFSVPALAEDYSSEPFPLPDAISVQIDGSALKPTDAGGAPVPPFVENGTTYVPVRAVAEAFELSVSWDQATKTVFIGEKGGSPSLNDYINIYIDGREFAAKDADGTRVYPILRDGTTYMPIRAIGEAFGKSVFWDNVLKTAVIITPLSENDMETLKNALSPASLEGCTVTAKIYAAASEYDFANPGFSEVTGEADSASFLFGVLPEDVISSGAYCYRSGSDIIFGASVDGKLLADYAGNPPETVSGFETGRASVRLTVSNGIISGETVSVPVKYTDKGSIAFGCIETTLSRKAD